MVTTTSHLLLYNDKMQKQKAQNLGFTSLWSSEINEPDKSCNTSSMSLKDTFPLPSESYTLKITEIERKLIILTNFETFVQLQ